jgi:acyl-ACP thioesterase
MKLPQEVAARMTIDAPLPMPYGSRKIVPPEVEPIPLPAITVQRNDIDYNRHVNNAHYIRMALECIPEEFVPATLRVEYKRPVQPGAVIQPTLILQPMEAYVQLHVGDTLCAVVEFTR